MFPYMLFYFSLLMITFLSLLLRKYEGYFLLFSFFISILFIGLRVNVGADFTEYTRIYAQSGVTNFELGFDLIFNFFKELDFEYTSVSLVIFIITAIFFIFAIKKQKYKTLIYFCFLLFMFVPITSTIRQGLVIPFFTICLLNTERAKVYFLSVLAGCFFHYSILFMLFFFFIRHVKQSYQRTFLVLLIFAVLSAFNVVNYMILLLQYIPNLGTISSKILMYTQRYKVEFSLTSFSFKLAGLLFLSLFMNYIKDDKKLLCCYNLYFITLCLFILFKDNSVLTNRLTYATNISLVVFFSVLLPYIKNFHQKAIITTLFVMYFTFSYFKFVATDLRHSVEPAYLPYQTLLL